MKRHILQKLKIEKLLMLDILARLQDFHSLGDKLHAQVLATGNYHVLRRLLLRVRSFIERGSFESSSHK